MTDQTIINREHFEAWLYAQPDSRPYDYMEGQPDSKIGCVLCNYIREATNHKYFMVGGQYLTMNGTNGRMPEWTLSLVNSSVVQCGSTFKVVKDHYTSLFGHNTPEIEPLPLPQPLTEILV